MSGYLPLHADTPKKKTPISGWKKKGGGGDNKSIIREIEHTQNSTSACNGINSSLCKNLAFDSACSTATWYLASIAFLSQPNSSTTRTGSIDVMAAK